MANTVTSITAMTHTPIPPIVRTMPLRGDGSTFNLPFPLRNICIASSRVVLWWVSLPVSWCASKVGDQRHRFNGQGTMIPHGYQVFGMFLQISLTNRFLTSLVEFADFSCPTLSFSTTRNLAISRVEVLPTVGSPTSPLPLISAGRMTNDCFLVP